MTTQQIDIEGFTVEADIKDGRITSLPCALVLEYCNGKTDVWYFERRARLYSSYAKQLAAIVTDENLQENELYQPYHLKQALCVIMDASGNPSITARHPEIDQETEGCIEQHNKPISYVPYRVFERENADA